VRTKVALLANAEIPAGAVKVDTVDGVVTLHGIVPSATARGRADAVARAVDGTRAVRNLLQIVPADHRRSVAVADDEIRAEVTRRLAALPALPRGSVTARSVANGVVLLGGRVGQEPQVLDAVAAARGISGVRRVASEIVVAEPTPDLAILDGHELSDDGRGLVATAHDAWITIQTHLALLASGDVPRHDINVDTTDGVVTLFGTVSSEDARRAAVRIARSVGGVQQVVDRLQVVAPRQRAAVEAHDDELRTRILQGIAARPALADTVVSVAVKNGVARLTGSVPSPHHRLLAATAAGEVPGVRAVIADLTVRKMTRKVDTTAP
jgi:hyperosmotically inducible periplasmic protein